MVLASSIYIRVYVDSHSLGQLALASKRTASLYKMEVQKYLYDLFRLRKGIRSIELDMNHSCTAFRSEYGEDGKDIDHQKFVLGSNSISENHE